MIVLSCSLNVFQSRHLKNVGIQNHEAILKIITRKNRIWKESGFFLPRRLLKMSSSPIVRKKKKNESVKAKKEISCRIILLPAFCYSPPLCIRQFARTLEIFITLIKMFFFGFLWKSFNTFASFDPSDAF